MTTNSSRILKIYVLPSIKNQFTLHPRFLKPTSKLELSGLFAAYVLRKWRFQISDYFGEHFHKLAASKSPLMRRLHYKISDFTTRECVDEYFFKQIPTTATDIEFILPAEIDQTNVERQLKYWLLDSHKYSKNMIFTGLMLPTTVFLAKFIGLLTANVFLSYNLFRTNQYIRAFYGSKHLQTLINRGQVQWTISPELSQSIQKHSKSVSDELKSNGIEWEWKEGMDLHDDAIDLVSKEFKIPELLQSCRRSRMQYFIKGVSNKF